MVHHPEWLRHCQTEIDEICGDRMPTLKDMPALPTLRACIRETIRWRPPVPTASIDSVPGVAHETQVDQYDEGVFIKQGTRILPLEWQVYLSFSDHCFSRILITTITTRAFTRNSHKYPDPESFRPERWLSPEWPTTFQSPLTQYPSIKAASAFGWGQRTCLGSTLSTDELFVALGGLCWAYDLKFKVDGKGREIIFPTDKMTSLLIVKPEPFEMAFEPRSKARDLLVKRNWQEAKTLREFDMKSP
ncbi:MAG: hypothetical protein Q9227_000455 [Pyrenula ochraceoflavens]